MGLFNDRYKKLRGEKEEENKKGGVLNQRAQNIYDSRAANKYDEEERKEAEGDGSLSPFSTYRTANRERAEAAVTGYRQAMESEKLARQSYMQRFGVMDAEDRSDKFMDPALSAASKAERVRQNTEKARRMFGIHEDADDYAAAARRAANEATARIRKQAGEIDRAAGEIDRIYGAGTAKAMKEDLGAIGKSAWERSAFADNDKLVSDFYNSRGGLTISGKTAAERRAQETKLEQERERLVKLANQGEEVVEETPGVTVGDMYENPFPLRKGTTGENQEYIDEYGRATGRTVRERIAEIDAELNAYRMYQSAADKLVTGVAAQYEDAKKNGVKRQPTIAELDALEGLSPEEKDAAVRRMMAGGDADVDALFEMTDQDYRDYYNTVPFVAWYASKTTFGDIPGVNRSLETEGKLADNTNVNFEYLTDEEKRALIWVLHNEGGEQVNAILADMQPELDRRSVTQRAEEQRERNVKFFGGAGGTAAALAAFGVPGAVIAALPSETKGKVLTDVFNSAASVPVSVASAPLSFLDSLAQSIPDADGEVRRNPYGTYQRPRKWAETVRSDTAEDLEGLTGGGKILGMGLGDVYMAGMSAADSVVGSMAMGPAYSVIMGMGAASDEMNRLAEAGASNGQAVVGGLLAGVAETVFEHVSLEYFAKNFISGVPENWADFIKKTLVQAGVEGSEEVVTEIANTLSNSQVMGTQSDWNKAVREYIDAGMTRKEAYRRVWVDKAYELWKSGASGALSGGMMAGGVAGVVRDNMQRAAETRQIGADITEANKGRALSKQALDIAASGNVDARTAKALEKAAEAYDKKNDVKRAGKLFRAVTDAVNEGITDAEAQETAAGKVAAVLLGDGVDYVKASDPETGDAVTVDRAAPIARTEGGSVYMNTDRGEVALEDLAFEDDAVRDMIYSISEYGPEYANMVLTNYGGEDIGTYLGGMREGILTGQYGDLGEELYDFNSLSRADQNLALKIGQAIRADQVAAKAEAAKAARLSELNVRGRDLTKQDMKIEGVRAGRGASGRVGQLYFDQGVKVESDLDRANADFAKLVSVVYGNDIVVFDSEQNPELKNKNGMHVGSDGSIWVDIRAGEARQGLVAYALSHEMTHEAAQWAPEAYRAFTDFLTKNYAEQGVSVRQLISKKMADMGTDNFDAAFDEVIADACERFLLDSNAIEKLNEMRKTDRTTFEKIRDFIKSAIAKLREALQSLKTAGRLEGTEASEAFRNSATGEQIEELEKKIKQLEDAWSLVLMEAAENRAKASGETAAAENVQNSERTGRLTKDDYARYMELAKDPEKNEAELSRMVEAAAELAMPDSKIRTSNGKLREVYHGTNGDNFTVFDWDRTQGRDGGWFGRGFYFSFWKGEARSYGARVLDAYLNITKPFVFKDELLELGDLHPQGTDATSLVFMINFAEKFPNLAEGKTLEVVTGWDENGYGITKEIPWSNLRGEIEGFMARPDFRIMEIQDSYGGNAEGLKYEYVSKNGPGKWDYAYSYPYMSREEAEKSRFDAAVQMLFRRGVVYHSADFHMPHTYIGDIGTEFSEALKKRGFDGVLQTREGDEVVAFYSAQIKSADPVTYDDQGNVIPLDERFNPEREDIRYSTRTGAAEAQTGDEKKKNERETAGVFASTRTGTSTSTRAVVERALETLKDGPEKTALTAYKRVLDQIDKTIAEYSEARKNRDAAAAAEAKKQLNTLQAKARKMETAPAMQNVAALQDVAALNEDVRNLSRLLKLQSTETGGAIAMKSSLENAASDLMKEHGIRRGKAELVELLNNFYTDMTREVRAETLNREYMVAAAQPVADWLVRTAPVATEIDQNVEATLKELKGAKIRVNDQQRGDIENKYGDFNKWRKSLYPYVIVTSDPSAMTLDSLWDELSEAHPEFFDPEISWGDQGVALRDVLADLKSRRVTEYYIGDEAYGWLRDAAANDVAEAFWKIKPYETVADKYAKEIRRLKEDHRAFRNIDEYIQDQKQAAYDLGYSRAKLQQARSEYRRRIRSLTENMSNRLIKPKVNKYIPESLQAATAEVLKAINLDSGRSKSFSEKLGQLREQYQKIIEREKAAQGIKKDQNGRYPITTEDQVVEDTLKLVQERVKDVPISEMSSVQLEAVYTALKMFDHVVRDRVNAESMKTLLDEKMTVQDIGERLIEESEATKERKGAISRYFNWQMRPEEFFETLAGYKKNSMWHRVYQMLDRAQRQQIMYEMQGNEIFRDVLKDQKYVRSLSAHKDGDLVDIGLKDAKENPYKITRGMMLSIWKHLQNEENMRHIMIGGLVAPDLKKYYDGKTENVYNEKENRIFGVIGAELASAYKRIETKISDLDDKWEAAKIRGDGETMDAVAAERDAAWAERDDIVERGRAIMDQIRKNIEALLTEQDRAFLAASDKFFDEFSRGILNDATRRMYGFEKAKVENYFPIHVSSAFLGANFESIKRDFSVEGSGFMKDRVQSSKPIMLEDFGSVIDRQISNVAKYAALAPALKDFSKIYSVIRGGAEFETSVGKTISERFGDQGVKYLENLIADLNGARSREASIFDKLRSRGAGAVLTLNPRVSMVQAASYVTAASELGYGPLARALLNPEGHAVIGKRAPTELIKKYSGMLWTRKERGNIDAAVAATRSLGNKRTLAESKLKFLTGWIEAVDAGTVGRLWYASEYYVQKKNPDMKGYKTSGDQKKIDQYYMKVADVFSNVIERTQPNYTVMQRPAVLRSTNAMTKALTMFMTQRLQNANILYSATRRWAKYSADYKAGINGVTREDVREARAGFVNAVTSQMISAATISAMRLVADMLLRNMKGRRDEDGEITGESVGWSLLNDFLSSAVSNFVGGSELYEAIRTALSGGKYYGISAGGLDQINDFVSDTVNVLKNVAKGEFKPKELTAIGTDIGTLFGVPLNNAYKILKAIKGWGEAFGNETKAKGNLFDYGTGEIWESGPMERTKKQKGNLMLKAYREGNKERYREIQRQFNDTADATARENADAALLDAVYEEWKTGAIDDREALDILEATLEDPPETENDERMQIGRWETKKANEDLPKGEKETYGAMKDLRESFAAYVYPAPGTDRASTGAAAKAMIKQYREWGYDDEKIRDAIRETFKDQYVTLKPSEQREIKRYIVKLYSFTKDKNGDSYDASELIDKWKKTDAQIAAENAAEEVDEREWG